MQGSLNSHFLAFLGLLISWGIKKAIRGNHIDQLSNLPSDVIDGILQHLPTEDVVRTSILSRKWRYMWVSVPRLEFGHDFFENCIDRGIEDPEIPSIITEILLLHNGPISKFTIVIPKYYSRIITCLSKWILFLSRNGIKYLEIVYNGIGPNEMPSQLFSCQGLTHLKLGHFKLSLPPNFRGFKSLLELHLINIAFESGALERLISDCPVLNVLTISLCSGFDSIDVSAPSLKFLCIERQQDIKSICFKKAENLTDLKVENLTDLTLIMATHGQKFEQVDVSDFIEGLQKIKMLCIKGCFNYIKTLQMSISSLTYLESDGVDFNQSEEISFIVSLIKSSPFLVELVVKSSSVIEAPMSEHLRALYCNRCCLSQLRKVNITIGTAYEHAFNFIRFLFSNSSSLEILTFKFRFDRKQSDTAKLLRIFEYLKIQEQDLSFMMTSLNSD